MYPVTSSPGDEITRNRQPTKMATDGLFTIEKIVILSNPAEYMALGGQRHPVWTAVTLF